MPQPFQIFQSADSVFMALHAGAVREVYMEDPGGASGQLDGLSAGREGDTLVVEVTARMILLGSIALEITIVIK